MVALGRTWKLADQPDWRLATQSLIACSNCELDKSTPTRASESSNCSAADSRRPLPPPTGVAGGRHGRDDGRRREEPCGHRGWRTQCEQAKRLRIRRGDLRRADEHRADPGRKRACRDLRGDRVVAGGGWMLARHVRASSPRAENRNLIPFTRTIQPDRRRTRPATPCRRARIACPGRRFAHRWRDAGRQPRLVLR